MKKNTNNFTNFAMMRIYLFGKYEGPMAFLTDEAEAWHFSEEKSLEKAIKHIPSYLASMYGEGDDCQLLMFQHDWYMMDKGYYVRKYVPEQELFELVSDMKRAGYGDCEIVQFTTEFVKGIQEHEKVFYSSMYLYLFGTLQGKHEILVDIPEIKNFEQAIAFVPDYVDFLATTYEKDYLDEGTADLDDELYKIVRKMNAENFRGEDIERFACAWFEAIYAQHKITLMLPHIYLFGKFEHSIWSNKDKVVIMLSEQKNFEKALKIIPTYIEYMINYYQTWWDEGVRLCPQKTLDIVVNKMREFGEYTEGDIAELVSKWEGAVSSIKN